MRSLTTPAVVIALLACLFILPFWLVAPVGFAYMVYRTLGRGLEVKALLDRGMAGDAVVTRRWRMRISANRYETMLKYAFRTPDGRRIESRTMGSGHAVSEMAAGSTIPIIYLPENPAVNAPKWLVEQSRTEPAT